MIFKPTGSDHDSRNETYLCLETPGHSKWLKKIQIHVKIRLWEISKLGHRAFWWIWEKARADQSRRSVSYFSKSWIQDQYLSKAWNGSLVIWDQYLPKATESTYTFQSYSIFNLHNKTANNYKQRTTNHYSQGNSGLQLLLVLQFPPCDLQAFSLQRLGWSVASCVPHRLLKLLFTPHESITPFWIALDLSSISNHREIMRRSVFFHQPRSGVGGI